MARDDVAEALRWAREIHPETLRRYGGASGSGGPGGFALDREPSERNFAGETRDDVTLDGVRAAGDEVAPPGNVPRRPRG